MDNRVEGYRYESELGKRGVDYILKTIVEKWYEKQKMIMYLLRCSSTITLALTVARRWGGGDVVKNIQGGRNFDETRRN